MKIFSGLNILLLLGMASCKVPANQVKRDIDKVKLSDLEGRETDLRKYDGKTVFINFWATWCKPCLAEMPSIEKAQNKLQGRNIEFVLASAETAEHIQQFKEQYHYPFHFVRAENTEELGIMALPATLIFTRGGKLAFSEMGYRQWDAEKNIDLILKIAASNE